MDQNFNFSMRLAKLLHYYSSMNAFKLVFSAKSCFKVVVISVENPEPIINPYNKVLRYFNDRYY